MILIESKFIFVFVKNGLLKIWKHNHFIWFY